MEQSAAVTMITGFKSMAADPVKRQFLASDSTCVGGLVMVLSNQDVNVVKMALETLDLLSECAEQLPFLSSFMGIHEQLQSVIDKEDYNCEVQDLAKKLKTIFTRHLTPLKETASGNDIRTTPIQTSRRHNKNFFFAGQIGKSKKIILQIQGLTDKADLEVCRNNFLRIKGLISVTFDLSKKRSIIRAKAEVTPESLVHAVGMSGTMSAVQVVRDDEGKEKFIVFGACAAEVEKENHDLPEYLPDEASPVRVETKPMTRLGGAPQNGNGWLSKAAGFLTNSFYW
ncbi:armadillo repeat-containing protein 1-like [Lineus longissimus]|uniref:armadillo repeat-containing protein 1-like n=1 Tax=Lineus longissimus TaxID=88925 RepID=UPI002B4DFDA2